MFLLQDRFGRLGRSAVKAPLWIEGAGGSSAARWVLETWLGSDLLAYIFLLNQHAKRSDFKKTVIASNMDVQVPPYACIATAKKH
ncbi:MAG: hypothetical protein V4812_03800 [Pseudomonadota bacterium]